MPASAEDLAFRRQLVALRDVVATRVDRLYAQGFDLDDVDAALERIRPQLVELLEVSQESAVTYALAYLEQLTGSPPPDVESPAGTTSRGQPLLAAMGAWAVLVKAQIGLGRPTEEVATYARYLAQRFADHETSAAADRVLDDAAAKTPEIVAWEGVVSATACGPCRGRNSGQHPLSQPIYRHGGCSCTKTYVTGPAPA